MGIPIAKPTIPRKLPKNPISEFSSKNKKKKINGNLKQWNGKENVLKRKSCIKEEDFDEKV